MVMDWVSNSSWRYAELLIFFFLRNCWIADVHKNHGLDRSGSARWIVEPAHKNDPNGLRIQPTVQRWASSGSEVLNRSSGCFQIFLWHPWPDVGAGAAPWPFAAAFKYNAAHPRDEWCFLGIAPWVDHEPSNTLFYYFSCFPKSFFLV